MRCLSTLNIEDRTLPKVAFRGRTEKREKRSPTASLREGSRGAYAWQDLAEWLSRDVR